MDKPVLDELIALIPRLRRFARALTASAEEAEDLLQDALERGVSRLNQWQQGTRLDSWMYRVMQNLRNGQARAPSARYRGDMPGEESLLGADGVAETEMRLLLRDVRRAFDQLPDQQRAVLVLVCVDGLGYREAAEVMGVPIGTVMSRLARARLELHRLVDRPDDKGKIIQMKAAERS